MLSKILLSSGLLQFSLELWSRREGLQCVSSLSQTTSFLSGTPEILNPQIHLLGNSSEEAGAGRSGRQEVYPPIPHQAGVTLVCLLSSSAALARGESFPWAPASYALTMGVLESLPVFASAASSVLV